MKHYVKTILLVCMALVTLVWSCKKDTNPEVTPGSVLFNYSFAGSSDTGNECLENENDISDLKACLFGEDGLLYSIVTPQNNGNNWSLSIEDDGKYEMYLLANSGLTLEAGVTKLEDFQKTVLNAELKEGSPLVLVSESPAKFVYESSAEDIFVGKLVLNRPASRIDIVNAVDDMVIKGVMVKNIAESTSLFPSFKPETVEYADVELSGLSLAGNSTTPAALAGKIYTFQHDASAEHPLSVEISYTMNGRDFTETVTFDGKDVPSVGRDMVYPIILCGVGAETPEYNVKVWNMAEPVVLTITGETMQQTLNKKLAINRFAKTNVATIDNEALTVTFCKTNNSKDYKEEDASYFWCWDEGYVTNVYTDQDGQNWRVPTADEMRLLTPEQTRIVKFSSPAMEILDYSEALPDLFGEKGSGGNGTSEFRSVKTGEVNNDVPYHTCYAIRFKNTKQAAAYRYKWENRGEDIDDAYISIRVKAMGEDGFTMDQVSDEEFWTEDYIEIILPAAGYGNGIYVDPISINERGKSGYYFTSTTKSTSMCYTLNFSSSDIRQASISVGSVYALRLVKID